MGASVRLKVQDPQGFSFGSGTIIDNRQGDVLILTCGHLFRDSRGQGEITLDFFAAGGPRGVKGNLVTYDLKNDVALVWAHSDAPLSPVRVEPRWLPLSGSASFAMRSRPRKP